MGNMVHGGKFKKRGNHEHKLPVVGAVPFGEEDCLRDDDGVYLLALQEESLDDARSGWNFE